MKRKYLSQRVGKCSFGQRTVALTSQSTEIVSRVIRCPWHTPLLFVSCNLSLKGHGRYSFLELAERTANSAELDSPFHAPPIKSDIQQFYVSGGNNFIIIILNYERKIGSGNPIARQDIFWSVRFQRTWGINPGIYWLSVYSHLLCLLRHQVLAGFMYLLADHSFSSYASDMPIENTWEWIDHRSARRSMEIRNGTIHLCW